MMESSSQDEFASYEANDPFSQTLMVQVDGLLGSFMPLLTEDNYKALVGVLVSEVAEQLEKAVFKSSFNRVCIVGIVVVKVVMVVEASVVVVTFPDYHLSFPLCLSAEIDRIDVDSRSPPNPRWIEKNKKWVKIPKINYHPLLSSWDIQNRYKW